MKKLVFGILAVTCLGLAEAQAASIFVPGPFPVAPISGTTIDFEGQSEGTIITNEYGGVIFSQTGGGAPMIDNKAFTFAYESGSGLGVLTGSAQGGNVATTAGIIATFDSAVAQVGAFVSDTAPLGNYTISAFGAGGVFLESFDILAAQFPTIANDRCTGAPFNGTGCGVFAGFSRPTADIWAIQFGPSSALAGTDAFAIDDFVFNAAVPEPAVLALLGPALAALILRRRASRKQQ